MKGYRVRAWGADPVFEEIPDPVARAGEVVVDVEACGVGLTVLNCINGDLADDDRLLPRVPGHELVGRVTDAGPGVERSLIGRRIVAYFYRHCGRCPECTSGRQSRCRNLAGWIGVHSDGGYAPRTVLPARNAVVVDDAVDAIAATVVPDAVATPYHVCADRARVHVGDRVAVIGAGGGVGAHLIQMAALFGAEVAGLDIGERKLAMVEQLGATPVDSSSFLALDPDRLFGGASGRPTVVVDLVGTDESLRWAAGALAMGGRLVVLTTFPGRTAAVDPRTFVFHELAVLGSRYASVDEVSAAADLVMSGRIRPVISDVVGPDSVLELHGALRRGELVGRGALVWS